MSPLEVSVLALNGLAGWLALVIVTMHFRLAQARILRTMDRLTDNIVQMKNPWAAQAVEAVRETERARANGDWPRREHLEVDEEVTL